MTDIAKTMEDLVRMVRILAQHHAPTMAADDVIGVTGVLPPWKPGKYTAGTDDTPPSIVQHNGQPARCLQDHDSTGNPDWCPGKAPSLWGAYHARSAARALPWQAPTGAHDTYNDGEYMIYTDGVTYLCGVNGTVHGPDVLPGSWTAVTE